MGSFPVQPGRPADISEPAACDLDTIAKAYVEGVRRRGLRPIGAGHRCYLANLFG